MTNDQLSSTHLPPTHLPIVQSIPHAGLGIPPEVADRLAISERAIYNECDLWADQLFDLHASGEMELAPLAVVTTTISRALVDVNRLPDDLDNPDGPIKSQTSYGELIYRLPLTTEDKRMLIDRYWRPYHARLEAALAEHAGQVKLLLDCHNMAQRGPTTYDFPGAARPFLCLANLGDRRGEPLTPGGKITCPAALLRRAGEIATDLFADMTLLDKDETGDVPIVALNWPFIGGILIDQYAHGIGAGSVVAPHLHESKCARAPYAIMVEINRGLFVGNQNAHTPVAPPNLERIAMIRQRLQRWMHELIDF